MFCSALTHMTSVKLLNIAKYEDAIYKPLIREDTATKVEVYCFARTASRYLPTSHYTR